MRKPAIPFLVVSIFMFVAGLGIGYIDSFSFYEPKYGRDLEFSGLSKWVLVSGFFTISIAMLLTSIRRNRQREILNPKPIPEVLFLMAAILIIGAYVLELQ